MVLKFAIFGEAEKGKFGFFYKINSLDGLYGTFGNPPEESEGLALAVQGLLFNYEVIFFRVEEEGFSFEDYHKGLNLLRQKEINALGLPGVGNMELLEKASAICKYYKSLLILKEKDLYDYLTN